MDARRIINNISKYIKPENIVRLESYIRFHKKLNIDNPQKLSEKICHIEFRTESDLRKRCTDKYSVRGYVKDKGYGHILIPLVHDKVSRTEEIDFDSLPESFVMKATFGCKMNYICRDKRDTSESEIRAVAEKWIKEGFDRDKLEPHYSGLPRDIIFERYIGSPDGMIDYKIHCLNGKPEFVLVCSEREQELRLNVYDLKWDPMDVICGKHKNNKEIRRPERLDDMLMISRSLAGGFDFVRVDLYEVDDIIYFGELTFTPDGGILSYYTDEFDLEMGKRLHFSQI